MRPDETGGGPQRCAVHRGGVGGSNRVRIDRLSSTKAGFFPGNRGQLVRHRWAPRRGSNVQAVSKNERTSPTPMSLPSSAPQQKSPDAQTGTDAGRPVGNAANWDEEDPLPRRLTATEAEALRGQRSAPS